MRKEKIAYQLKRSKDNNIKTLAPLSINGLEFLSSKDANFIGEMFFVDLPIQ